MNERRRLFFALVPDAETRDRLADISASLPGELGRRVRPENLHLTLVFVGNADTELADCLQTRATTVEPPEFCFTLDLLGHFPRSGVLWLGSRERSRPLLDLVGALAAALEPCGFRPERRPFAPHVTLMRKVRRRGSLPQAAALEWRAREFVLMESITTDGGVRYQALSRHPLSCGD